MRIPTGDGPDYIIHRMKDYVAISWKLVIAGAAVVLWGLFVLVPYVFAEDPSPGTLIRWTIVALFSVVLTFVLPPLMARERRGVAVGTVAGVAVAVALTWISTA